MACSETSRNYLKGFGLNTYIYFSTLLTLLASPLFYYTFFVKYQRDDSTSILKPVNEMQYTRNILTSTLYPLTLDSPYVINNPHICTDVSNLKFLIIVHSSTKHFQRRRIARETWASKKIFKNINLRIVFFFGLTKEKLVQELIENESIVYGDVVQGNFLDTYHNLTHKGVLAYRWTQEFCPEAEMIVKLDDDVFLNVFTLLNTYYPKFKSNNRTIVCHSIPKNRNLIHRHRTKWKVDMHLFRGYSRYPVSYCMGYVVLISRDLIRPLYRAAYLTPFFWVDDVYLYGMLPNKVGDVKYENIRNKLVKNTDFGLRCYREKENCSLLAVIGWHKDEGAFDKLWYAVLSRLSPGMKNEVNPLLLPEEE